MSAMRVKRFGAVFCATAFLAMMVLAPAADARIKRGGDGGGKKGKVCYDMSGNQVPCR